MSGLAAAPRLARGPRTAPQALDAGGSLAIRLATFAALAGFAALHWGSLLAPLPAGRALLIVAVTTTGGAALALTGRLRLGWPAALALRLAIVVVTLAAAMLAAGLDAYLLAPRNWDELGDGLDRGLGAIATIDWPYAGDDHWIRLTTLLGLPPALTVAAALSFWPAGRATEGLRTEALAVLVVVYAAPVTEEQLEAPILRGVVLLALIAAWLWAPRMRRVDAQAALAVLALAGVLAIPLAGALDARQPWIARSSWDWFEGSRGNSTKFDWNHRYGPITWPREGTTLLQVRSDRPHYWKAETLNRFDGLRWVRSGTEGRFGATSELPATIDRRWDERIKFTVRRLESDLVIGAGTIYDYDGPGATIGSSDGTTRLLDGSLERGDSYTVRAYVPDPTAQAMRAAGDSFPADLARYTQVEVPAQSATPEDRLGAAGDAYPAARSTETIAPPARGQPETGPIDTAAAFEASPYRRTYRLARRLAAGQPTTYDVVRNVERYLERNYTYNEKPPTQPVPLEAFLFEDKIGYCQQFSGAMALILRMDGIPARVAAGFSPGALNPRTHEFRVRDLDAHSWVEVYFAGIGWVPFDPTPTLSPASSQSGDDQAASAARGGSDTGSSGGGTASDRAGGGAGADPVSDDGRSPWVIVPAIALLAAAAAVGLRLRSRRLRRAAAAGPDSDVAELRAALERLGHDVPARTTLAQLERRLAAIAGPAAARYARLLRDRRFGPPGARGPGRDERRALRRALAASGGPLGHLRIFVALPPQVGR